MQLQGKNSLVTGSGRGIGAGIALRLASEGANVAVASLEGDAGTESIAAQIRAMVTFLASDASDQINGQNILVDGGLTALSPQPPYQAQQR